MARTCCAPAAPPTPDSYAWAQSTFGQADLGDPRRTARLVATAAALRQQPALSLPKQCPDPAALAGAYRFLSNRHIVPEQILTGPQAALVAGSAQWPVLLCVQDDTQLDFTCRTGTAGLGRLGDGEGRGLLQHTCLAVRPDRQVLGLLDARWIAPPPHPPAEKRRARQARWNQTDLWQEAAERVARLALASRIVHVADREADIFRFLARVRALGQDLVIRAKYDRQVLPTRSDAPEAACLGTLWAHLERQEVQGTFRVAVGPHRDGGNRVTRAARHAQVSVRLSPVRFPPPVNDPRTRAAAAVDLTAVLVQEIAPPAGVEPIAWLLLTSLPVADFSAAGVVIGYYTCRWVIEEFHRCLKEGCRMEASQLDHADDLRRLGAILSLVAVDLLAMRDLADPARGEAAAEDPAALAARVDPLTLWVVAQLAGVSVQALTPRQLYQTVARRGGYLGRKHDPRPGWKVLWRGWQDILLLAQGAWLFQQTPQEKRLV